MNKIIYYIIGIVIGSASLYGVYAYNTFGTKDLINNNKAIDLTQKEPAFGVSVPIVQTQDKEVNSQTSHPTTAIPSSRSENTPSPQESASISAETQKNENIDRTEIPKSRNLISDSDYSKKLINDFKCQSPKNFKAVYNLITSLGNNYSTNVLSWDSAGDKYNISSFGEITLGECGYVIYEQDLRRGTNNYTDPVKITEINPGPDYYHLNAGGESLEIRQEYVDSVINKIKYIIYAFPKDLDIISELYPGSIFDFFSDPSEAIVELKPNQDICQ